MGWFKDLFDEEPKAKSRPATVKVEGKEEVKEEPKVINFNITGKLTYEFIDRVADAEYQNDYREWEKEKSFPYIASKPYRYIAKFTYDILANDIPINDSFKLGLSKHDERTALILLFEHIESLKNGNEEELMEMVKDKVKNSIVTYYENLKLDDLRARLDDHFNEDSITLNFQVKVEKGKL